MTTTDRMTPLGTVTNYDGAEVMTHAAGDGLDLAWVTVLRPAAVRKLESILAAYWNELARYRLRGIDLAAHKIDEGWLRDGLAGLGFGVPRCPEGLDYLASVDWAEAGSRLAAERPGTFSNVRKLHALLTGDETPATEAAS